MRLSGWSVGPHPENLGFGSRSRAHTWAAGSLPAPGWGHVRVGGSLSMGLSHIDVSLSPCPPLPPTQKEEKYLMFWLKGKLAFSLGATFLHFPGGPLWEDGLSVPVAGEAVTTILHGTLATRGHHAQGQTRSHSPPTVPRRGGHSPAKGGTLRPRVSERRDCAGGRRLGGV